MPDEIRVNRAAQVQSQPQQSTYQTGEEAAPQKNPKAPWIILGVIVIVLVVLGILFRGSLFKGQTSSTGTAATDATSKPSGYQAVFLTNGQVYFGKISSAESDYVDLKDIFYLQVVTPPLQGNQQGATQQAAQQQISLVKLGNELHGPVDEMHISRAQILFYEDLKTDGQVVKAITAYKATPAAAPAATAPADQQPAAAPAAAPATAPATIPTK